MAKEKKTPPKSSPNTTGDDSKTNPNFGDKIIKGDNPNLPTFHNPPQPPPDKKDDD